nr:unnamed protein product [Callosobruchus chinensis]
MQSRGGQFYSSVTQP